MKKLDKTGKLTSFKVPEGYFEGFEQRLEQRIHNQDDAATPRKKSILFRPWINLAAGFALIALLYTLIPAKIIQKQQQANGSDLVLHELQQSELLNEYELVKWLTNLNSDHFELYPDSLLFQNLNEEDLIYLSYIE